MALPLLQRLQKARDVLFGTLDLSSIAASAGYRATVGPQQGGTDPTVPEAVNRSLADQGMTWGSPFSPGAPIEPFQPLGTPPVKRVYRVGQNVYLQPRSELGVDFSTMQQILDPWDLANLCINTRIDHLRVPDWSIEARRREDREKYADDIVKLTAFFERPDGHMAFDSWLSLWMRQWLRYDAAAIFRRRTRAGKLTGLEIIDGTTISMLVDGRGGMPEPPAPAYVQWAWGLPWVWLSAKDVLYEPYWPREGSRYGMPPVEWLLMQGNTDLRLQLFFLTAFTDGEVPAVFLNAPEDVRDPKQLDALQAKYDALLAGRINGRHRVVIIPPTSHVHPQKDLKFDVAFAAHVVIKTASAFGCQPAEIGFTENVNRSSGDSQEDIQYRRSILPAARYFETRINRILAEDLNSPWARFKFRGIEEEDDKMKLAQIDEILVRNGIKSPDLAAEERGLPVDPDNPVGRLFILRTGVAFIEDAKAMSAAQAQQAATQAGADPGVLADEEDDETGGAESASGISEEGALKPPKTSAPASPTSAKAIRADLRKWRDVAVSRARSGRPQRAFVSDAIPVAIGRRIESDLAKADGPDAVRAVFAGYLGSGGAPPFAKAAPHEPLRFDAERRREIEAAALLAAAAFLKQQRDEFPAYMAANWPANEGAQAVRLSHALSAVDRYDWTTIEKLAKGLARPIGDAAEEAATAAVLSVESQVAPEAAAQLAQGAIAYAQQRGAEMVGKRLLPDGTLIGNPNAVWRIDESTREMLRKVVEKAIQEGDSAYAARERIKGAPAFNDTRAETIARTEAGMAYNRGSVIGYRSLGLSKVLIFDGEEFDDACRQADGEVWSLDYYEAHPLQHPRCVRAASGLPSDDPTPIDRY